MNHGSLFSGGGGFDLAASRAGWNNVFHCEWNTFCQTILKHYWPYAESISNIKEFNASKFRGKIDIITGGFPCQPFSQAGKRRGTDDDRYLWPEMLRVISEVQPRWIVGENVQGILTWNEGMVFEQVHADLEAQGYEVQAFLLPAAGVNAPHRRYRVWFVAYAPDKGQPKQNHSAISRWKEEGVFNRNGLFFEPTGHGGEKLITSSGWSEFGKATDWTSWPTQYPLCSGNDGLSDRLDGITFYEWRKETIRIFGNAIVPAVAGQIFSAINYIESAA